MSLLFPWALAWASAALGVVLLYMLRKRERPMPVSALFLWDRVPPDAMSRMARWLPRRDLILWTQVGAVLFMALMLAAPMLLQERPAGETAVVVDTSITLAPAGRLEEAQDAARRIMRESAGPWVLVGWGDPPQILAGPTEREEVFLAGVAGLSYTLASRPPLAHALALVPHAWDRVVVITGAPPEQPDVEVVALAPVENLAIEAFAVRAHPDGSGHQALVAVRNETTRYQNVVVTVRDVAGGHAFRQAMLLAPQSSDVFVFPLWGVVGPAYVAELLPDDAFPYDNIRYYALDMPASLRIRWEGDQDRYLWAALQAAAAAERAEAPPWDLTVVVRTELEAAPDGPCLLVEAGVPEAPRGELRPAGPWSVEPDLLLQHVDHRPWALTALHQISPPEDAIVPMWSGDLPAIARWRVPEGPRVALALEMARSNLPLTPGFPVLIRNALAWLLPGPDGRTVTVGAAMRLPAGTLIQTPTGAVDTVWVPEEPGLFETEERGRRKYIAANVPPVSLAAPGAAEEVAGDRVLHKAPIWPWVAGVALGLLLFEWALARRWGT